jgi:hypothetical protein
VTGDRAERLMDAAVRLLPRQQRVWGSAMLAELSAIESRAERWRFAFGCLRVMATRPAVWRRFGSPLLAVAVLVASLWWTGRFEYAPLRWVSVMVVAILVGLGRLGRRGGPFGPVRDDVTARCVRVGGYVLVAMWTVGLLTAMATKNPADVDTAAPILGAVMASYLAGFLVLTARSTAGRVLIAGLTGGVAPVVVWTGEVILVPPIPASAAPAMMLIVFGMLVAAVVADGGPRRRLQAAAYAGMVAAILLVSMVMMLSAYAPAGLIPDLAPHALSAADDLAQSRIEIQDPYVALLLLGAALAGLPIIAALHTTGWRRFEPRRVG